MIQQYAALGSLIMSVCWVLIYILMIRRGLLDKSFGMPIIALCMNISWEFNFTFFTQIDMTYRAYNGFFFLFDLGVLYTCFRFGKDDFNWPILKNHFRPILVFCLALSFTLLFLFVRAFDDNYGGLFASINTPVYSALMIAMLIRRDSVKGQNLYIGLLMLIGDSAAYIPTLNAQLQGWASTPVLWIHTFMITTLLLHVLYILLYCHVARRDGVNLWKRI